MCWWWGAACVPLKAWSSCASCPVICLANLFVLENVAQTLFLRETWHRSQDHVTPSCGRWLPVSPTLGVVTQVCVFLSEEGSQPGPGEGCPGVAQMERGVSKGTCLWEAGLDPTRCSIQACVSRLGHPTVDPHRAEVQECSRSSVVLTRPGCPFQSLRELPNIQMPRPSPESVQGVGRGQH